MSGVRDAIVFWPAPRSNAAWTPILLRAGTTGQLNSLDGIGRRVTRPDDRSKVIPTWMPHQCDGGNGRDDALRGWATDRRARVNAAASAKPGRARLTTRSQMAHEGK